MPGVDKLSTLAYNLLYNMLITIMLEFDNTGG